MFQALKEDKRGFTLVEILVVLVILAILAAVSIPSLTGFIGETKKKAYIVEARTVYAAAQAYASENYDEADDDLEAALENNIDGGHVLNNILTGSVSTAKDPKITSIDIENHVIKKIRYEVDGYYIEFNPNGAGSAEEIICDKVSAAK